MVYIIILNLHNHILFFNKFEKYVYVNVKISIINKNEIIISFININNLNVINGKKDIFTSFLKLNNKYIII